MKVRYTTERKTGASFPGLDTVKEHKSFNMRFEQLTFKKIVFGLFCIMIYFFVGNLSEFTAVNGTIDKRGYVNPGAYVDEQGYVEFDDSLFNEYRNLEGFDGTLTTTIKDINGFLVSYNAGEAGTLSFEQWMLEQFPDFVRWKYGVIDRDAWWAVLINKAFKLLYGIVEYLGTLIYTFVYRLGWLLKMLWALLKT